MAAEGISKLFGRGGSKTAKQNIVYASRNVPTKVRVVKKSLDRLL